MAAAALAIALAGCSGHGGGGAADGGADALPSACDPAAQDCPSGSKCDFGCQGSDVTLACRPDQGGGAVGAPCSASMPCARGAACTTTPDAGAACHESCTGDGDCATGERCHNVTLTVGCGGASPSIPLHYCY